MAENIVEQAKRLVAAFRAANPGKRIAVKADGKTSLVDARPEQLAWTNQ